MYKKNKRHIKRISSKWRVIPKISKQLSSFPKGRAEYKLSIISFGAVSLFLYVRNTPILGETLRINDLLLIAGCVSGALIPAFILSSFIGCIVPIIFKKIKIDPAVASGPLITTLNDIVGIVSYYGLAMLLFRSVL